jgi:surface antigen
VRGTWLVALLAVACTTGNPGGAVDAGAGAPPELGSTLNVRVEGDSVRLELHVTNVTQGTLRLEFGSTQRFDFTVHGAGVEWRWADGMMFAQVIEHETLLQGESRRFTAAWPVEGRTGEFTATARLTSFNYPVELRTAFRLPAE